MNARSKIQCKPVIPRSKIRAIPRSKIPCFLTSERTIIKDGSDRKIIHSESTERKIIQAHQQVVNGRSFLHTSKAMNVRSFIRRALNVRSFTSRSKNNCWQSERKIVSAAIEREISCCDGVNARSFVAMGLNARSLEILQMRYEPPYPRGANRDFQKMSPVNTCLFFWNMCQISNRADNVVYLQQPFSHRTVKWTWDHSMRAQVYF